ncbi:IclR family transcriptional regulator [Specibacter sp. RAF43]|uniref:IclR family transcriptional regulator n=1 Tax=Specibacter sp. RAF43 TaxID=3233057 RepID=UPI003F9B5E94
MSETAVQESAISKTFDRGLLALEYISDHPAGVTLTQVAKHLEVHRTIAHRLVGTLERHNLVKRSDMKLISPAIGLIRLAESVDQDLRKVARPLLQVLADKLGATAHLIVATGHGQAQALLVMEPTSAVAHIAFRAGQVHPIDEGSGGLAILAARPPVEGERPEVTEARSRGYAVSSGEVIPSAWGLSAHVPSGSGIVDFSIGVTVFRPSMLEVCAPEVLRSAAELGGLLGERPRQFMTV